MDELSALNEAEPRALWADEIGFSNWLHGNIAVLGDVLEIRLVSLRREARVGRLSADILATIEGTDDRVIIENQIFDANHGHFGQVITYAAHYDARVIIWISTRFRAEYRTAIASFNALSNKRFFAVELRTRAGETPSFEIVAGPASAFRDDVNAQNEEVVPMSHDPRGNPSGAFIRAPYAIPSDRSESPGQLVLNAIFEMMAEMLQGSSEFPRLRKPSCDRNYYVIATGPVPRSEWAVTFENVQVGVALVFTNADTAVRDLEKVGHFAANIGAAVGYGIDFRPVGGRDKQKAILYRPVLTNNAPRRQSKSHVGALILSPDSPRKYGA